MNSKLGLSYRQTIRCHIIACLTLTCCVHIGTATTPVPDTQDYVIQLVGTKEGLPANSITSIAQTPEGYLWLGTLFSGLLRYDGTRFVSFNSHNTPELPYNAINHLMTDSSGVLWIASYDGTLTTWNSSGFSLVAKQVGRIDAMLWSGPGKVIFLLRDGRLLEAVMVKDKWLLTYSQISEVAEKKLCADASGRVVLLVSSNELGFWKDGRYQKLTAPVGLGNEAMRCLVADTKGVVWISTDQSLFCLEGDRLVNKTPKEGGKKIRNMTASGVSLWIETDDGLRRYANEKWMTPPVVWSTDQETMLQYYQSDGKEGFWATDNQKGLIHFDATGDFRIFSSVDGLAGNAITTVFRDRDGSIWLGYLRGGLGQIRPRFIHSLGNTPDLGGTTINSVCEDADGAVWIGEAGRSIFRIKDSQCLRYSIPSPVPEPNTLVTVDASNRIWAYGHSGPLMRFDKGVFVPVVKSADLPKFVNLMLPTQDGRLWLGSYRTLGVVEGGKFHEMYTTDEYSGRPAALAESYDHTIWAGTYDGFLMRWRGHAFEKIEPPERATLGRLWSICPTPDGGLWIGTSEGGLLRWKDGKFSRLTLSNGLRSNSIIQVQLDNTGNLWLVTGFGIERIDSSSLAEFEHGGIGVVPVSHYGRGDGLLNTSGSIEFQPNCWHGRNGRLYFAMGSDVAIIQSNKVRVNSPLPMAAIEELRVNQIRVWPPSSASVPNATVGSPDSVPHVTIPPGHRDLEFQLAAPNFLATSLVQFQYRLEGFESKWHTVSGERLARYYSIPHGNYVFRVRASNGDNVFNPQSASLALSLQPHFYQTLWFQWSVSLGVGVGFALIGWFSARRRMRHHMEVLESNRKLEQERARIAKDMHDELGSKLTRISYVSEMVRQQQIESGSTHSMIDTIAQTSRELLRSMDEIVWAVNPRNDTLEHLAAYLGQYANEYFQNTPIKCFIEIPHQVPHLPVFSESRHHLFLSFKESLANILKHSGASHVEIQMIVTEIEFQIRVSDDGLGMDYDGTEFQDSLSPDADGLRNMRLRLEGVGGGCKIQSAPAKGTIVILSIPLDKTT